MWERWRVGWYSIAGVFKGIGQDPLLNWVVEKQNTYFKKLFYVQIQSYTYVYLTYILFDFIINLIIKNAIPTDYSSSEKQIKIIIPTADKHLVTLQIHCHRTGLYFQYKV